MLRAQVEQSSNENEELQVLKVAPENEEALSLIKQFIYVGKVRKCLTAFR